MRQAAGAIAARARGPLPPRRPLAVGCSPDPPRGVTTPPPTVVSQSAVQRNVVSAPKENPTSASLAPVATDKFLPNLHPGPYGICGQVPLETSTMLQAWSARESEEMGPHR